MSHSERNCIRRVLRRLERNPDFEGVDRRQMGTPNGTRVWDCSPTLNSDLQNTFNPLNGIENRPANASKREVCFDTLKRCSMVEEYRKGNLTLLFNVCPKWKRDVERRLLGS